METLKMNFFKMLAILSFIILLLTSACAQSSNSNNPKSVNNPKTKSIVETPKIDIQAAIIK